MLISDAEQFPGPGGRQIQKHEPKLRLSRSTLLLYCVRTSCSTPVPLSFTCTFTGTCTCTCSRTYVLSLSVLTCFQGPSADAEQLLRHLRPGTRLREHAQAGRVLAGALLLELPAAARGRRCVLAMITCDRSLRLRCDPL
jgi:hypothetical protein